MVKNPFSRLIKILTDVYTGGEAELSRLERFAHFCALVVRSFVRNRCFVRASALSYTTLLALIPLLAVAISVTSSLLKSEGEEKIYQAIDKMVSVVMPPATLNTNDQAVSLNLSPGMPVALPPANVAAETNVVAAGAGGLYACVQLVVTPDSVFGMLVSAQPVVMTLFGGVASLVVVVVWAVLFPQLRKADVL